LEAAFEVGIGGRNSGKVVVGPGIDPDADAVPYPVNGVLEPESKPLTESGADAAVDSSGGVGNNQGFLPRAAVTFGITDRHPLSIRVIE
jgi:hypothetical protein